MTRLKQCMFLLAAFAGIFSLASRAPAQQYGYAPPGAYPGMQASYGPGGGMPPPAFGGAPTEMPGAMPPGPMPGGMPPGMPPGAMPGGGMPPDFAGGYADGGMEGCYGGDCGPGCGPGCGCLGCLLGFSDGYKLRPRWYDIQVDYLQLTREEVSRPVDFQSLGISGPIVLSTDSLDFSARPGMRLTGALLIAPSTNLEATYIGPFFWRTAASVSGNANLYSVFSDFGVTPAGGFADTDAATLASLEYTTKMNSVELSVRNRFSEPEGRYHASWLAGVRYVSIDETFRYATSTGAGSMNYQVQTFNDLVGFQVGGDFCIRPTPRLLIGTDAKAGIYGNPGEQQTTITSTSLGTVQERDINTEVAFVGEADFFAVYSLTQRFSIRGGYQLLYASGVALAPENFNATSPFGGARTAVVNVDGEVFYHGFNLGFEYVY